MSHYPIGTRVRVTQCYNGHGFARGTIVNLIRNGNPADGGDDQFQTDDRSSTWWMTPNEYEVVAISGVIPHSLVESVTGPVEALVPYWVAHAAAVIEWTTTPGDYSRGGGMTNTGTAVKFGQVVVEGSVEELRDFGVRFMQAVSEIEDALTKEESG